MLSGDYFIKPIDGDDQIAKSLVGLNAKDPEAIKQRIRQTAQAINIEDFATPMIEACRKALSAK